MSQTKLEHIPLDKIRENPVALREVDRTSESYLGLVDSIRKDGVLNAIVVREIVDPVSGETAYGLVDGLHRYTASQDAGKTSIPAQVTTMADGKVLEAQILANVHKVETKPVQYSQQLLRILAQNPLMPISELADKLSKSPAWLMDRLSLNKLEKNIAVLVDENKINLSNAYALAKLPVEEQVNFLDRAQTQSPQEFVPTAQARMKEIREAKRQGRAAAPQEFQAVAHLRKISEIKEEHERGVVAGVLVKELGVKDPVEAFKLGIAWALHLDPTSVAIAKRKDDERKAAAEAAKKKREEDKQAKLKTEAAAKQAEIEGKLAAASA
jgi:ParB/RepB/Spo0J family partition protein